MINTVNMSDMTIISEHCIPSCLYLTTRTIKPKNYSHVTVPSNDAIALCKKWFITVTFGDALLSFFFPASFNLLQTECSYIWHSTLTLPAEMTEIFNRSVRIPGGGGLPYKRLIGICRWMGAAFPD